MGTLIFDGECGFCTTAAGWIQRIAPEVTTVPWQRADLDALGVTAEAAAQAVQYVDDGGRVSAGAEAFARLLVTRGGIAGPVGRLMLLPGIRAIAARVYKLVSDNRSRLPGGTPACRVTS